MNWYKKSQQLEIVDPKKGHYTDIGHDIYMEENNKVLGIEENKNYSIDNPNIMWIYNNGQIETKPETDKSKTHKDPLAWGYNVYLDRLYTGRYSPSKKIITIIPPHVGVSQFRDIPESIKYLLKQTFPEANQIYVYSNSEKNIKISKSINWYKKASLYILGKNDHEWMGKFQNVWWEAIRLKNGEILYDPSCNHWSLFATYKKYIGDISNIESIGLLGGYGDYTIKKRGKEVKNYFFSSKIAQNVLKENPYYYNIGHGEDNDNIGSNLDVIWISDLNGNNFNLADPTNYEHAGLAYDVGLNQQIGTIQGRYDSHKNIVSINVDPSIATMNKLPNRLINRLYREFGNDITILDYSHGLPKRII